MSISAFSTPGPSPRLRAMIITVDPTNRTVQVMIKDQAPIPVVVWEVDTLFRWPKEGELWTIYQEQNNWKLDKPVAGTIEDMRPGDVRITAPGTVTINEALVARWADVAVQANGTASQPFAHNLGATARLVSLHGQTSPASWNWTPTSSTVATVTWNTTTYAAPTGGTSITATFIY